MSKIKKNYIANNFYKENDDSIYLYKKGNFLYKDKNEKYDALDYRDLIVEKVPRGSLKDLYEGLSKIEFDNEYEQALMTYFEERRDIYYSSNKIIHFKDHNINLSSPKSYILSYLLRDLNSIDIIRFYNKKGKHLLKVETRQAEVYIHLDEEEITE